MLNITPDAVIHFGIDSEGRPVPTVPTVARYDYEEMTVSLCKEQDSYLIPIEEIEMVPDLTSARLELEKLGYLVGSWVFGGIDFYAALVADPARA